MNITSVEQIATLTLVQLVAAYNEITGETLKAFRDKKTAIRRVTEAFNAAKMLAKKPTAAQVKAEEAGTAKPSRRTRAPYDYPPNASIRPCRASSRRGKLLAMLLRGARIEECAAIGFKPGKTHVNILEIHTWLGYGLSTDAHGIITAYTK